MRVIKAFCVAMALFLSGSAFGQSNLQELIENAAPGAEVLIPKGVWTEPIQIKKPLKLRGANAEECVLEVTSDSPAVRIESKGEVLLEGITIRWKRATSNRPAAPQAAVLVKDTALTIRNVRFIAPDSNVRCPSAFTAIGFSEVNMTGCEFRGFDFTLQFGEGAKGKISECVVIKPGHCGITAGPNSVVEVTGTIVSGSGYHGLRCTGGELVAKNNLVIANKNRGFYLGNKNARGEIRGNVIQDNGTGISGFAQSEVEIANNYIAGSEFAAIDMRDTCRLKVAQNLILDNARGIVLFKESGTNKNSILQNAARGNKTDSEGFPQAPEFVEVDASTDAVKADFFARKNGAVFGLPDSEIVGGLRARWQAIQKSAD